MTYQWVSASLLDGSIIADLPSFEPEWPLSRTVSDSTSATGTLYLHKAPSNWQWAIRAGGAVLACYDDSDPTLPIVWAGYVTDAPATDGDSITVSMSTYEDFLNWACVGDTTIPTTLARDSAIATVINGTLIPNTGVTNLQLAYTAGNGPKPAEALVWQNSDNATCKDRIDQLCAQLGGEYTVEWSWANGPGNGPIVPTLTFADRIGQAASTMGPNVVFDMPGSIITFQQENSYTADNGARKVVAYSSGQGDTVPYAPAVIGAADGRPIREYRYQPAPSISVASLTQYAKGALKVLAPGNQAITLSTATANAQAHGRQLGKDYRLGDDIGYAITGTYSGELGAVVPIKAFPNGLTGVGRMIGYSFDEQTVTPTLADKTVYVQADYSS